MTTLEKINLITGKVQQLLDKQQALTHHNQELSADLQQEKELTQQLQVENLELKQQLHTIQQDLERSRLEEAALKLKVSVLEAQVEEQRNAAGTLDDASRKAIEKQINHYIKEIDRCISLLSQ